jgi:hypothetical protein
MRDGEENLMIECPNCRNHALAGALFCQECGTQLTGNCETPTFSFQGDLTNQLAEIFPDLLDFSAPPPPIDVAVSLSIMDAGVIIPLEGQTVFTIGRSAEGQPILPDIDLAPYQAYDYGISRLHASISLGNQQTLVTDLGSANGTRLNGDIFPAHKPISVNHGDILTLGKFNIQLLIRQQADSE